MDAPGSRAAIQGHPWVEVQADRAGQHPGCDQSILPDARADGRVTRSELALKKMCEGKNEASSCSSHGDMLSNLEVN